MEASVSKWRIANGYDTNETKFWIFYFIRTITNVSILTLIVYPLQIMEQNYRNDKNPLLTFTTSLLFL